MKKYILIFITFFLISCNFNSTSQNREEDKKEAEKITERFYYFIKKNDKENAIELISKNLFKVTPKEKFSQILGSCSSECGEIKSYSLNHWETFVVKGTNPRSEYVLVYDVNRTIKNTKEKFTLKKENDSIKILGYNIEF
ncbi:hypothetical protein [Chryseobacterium jejuense]|uniref:hypothetical protein n=1 Tax=Chryseobacterium jejuense TaxID=445960 RepID=UPI001AE4D2D5|nr:hypothetical protein [Chryseobacterium jejuense]MBP2619398.1 hypothetical protein [Chryseobacterium jejuense]